MEENHQNFRLIAHALIQIGGKFLLIKRTSTKRGKPNVFPEYWDIPGGMVEISETPREATIRETKEEVNLNIEIGKVLHEDSNYDEEKKTVYTRIIYQGILLKNQKEKDIILQKDEHSEYILVDNLNNLKKVVDYLKLII